MPNDPLHKITYTAKASKYNLAMMIAGLPFPLAATPLLSFIATLTSVWWLIRSNTFKILDQPNSRSLHATPVPRTGGVGLVLGILTSWALLPAVLTIQVWFAVCMLVAVSLVDDIFTLPVWQRMLTHVIIATWLSAILLFPAHGWMLIIIVAFSIAWMTNLYNFMDGSDGLAGGMTLIGFSCYGFAAWIAGDETFAMLNFCIATAAVAFLMFNFHPARIFMGDSGSIPLGFLAAVIGVIGWRDGLWQFWLPLLVFSPFIADATATLVKRSLLGEKVWQAHYEHHYQRLVRSGFGHRNTALFGYVLMLASGTIALWATRQEAIIQLGAIVACCAAYLLMMFSFNRYWIRYCSDRQSAPN